jgi:hypothetical protein
MSDWLFDHAPSLYPTERDETHFSPHGEVYLLSDDGQLTLISAAKGGVHGPPGSGSPPPPPTGSPTSTLVGAVGGLQINLEWDTSVQSAANWSDIENAVVSAAQIFTANFATHAVLNIAVGLGEVNGQSIGTALGESESLGYAVGYTTLTNALTAADAGLVSSGLMAAGATTDAALAGKTFFVASAEAKALGLINATSTAIDGYIGLASGSVLAFVGAPGAGQYDAVGVAAHEISEVMGRIGIEGAGTHGYYTPLDLFRFTAPNQPDLTASPGYFSTDLGATVLNTYNDPKNGGDGTDWATSPGNATDAYDAFGNPGVTNTLTKTDMLEVAVLGYQMIGTPGPITA